MTAGCIIFITLHKRQQKFDKHSKSRAYILNIVISNYTVAMSGLLYCIILTSRVSFAFNLLISGDILVKNRYLPCSDVDFHTQSRVCEIITLEDEIKIERFGLSGCYGSTLSCAEGDIKTCMPVLTINNLHYRCFCNMPGNFNPVISDYYWSGWQKLSKPFREFIFQRKLMINNGADYVAEEYSRVSMDVQYVVADNSLPDDVFTASSYWDNHYLHIMKRARIDNYFDHACAWVGDFKIDSILWLKITLPDEYEVTGVYIKQRCDMEQYPTKVDVTTSVDDVLWQDVVIGEDIATRYSSYDMQGFVSVWFSRSYTARYWKIYIVEFFSASSMKCDLIGTAA